MLDEPLLDGLVELLPELAGGLLEAPPAVPDVPPEDELLPDVAGGVALLLGVLELEPELALPEAPGVPVADGLDEPEVPIFDELELLLLDDGVEVPEVPLVDGVDGDVFAGALALLPEDEPLVPLLLPLSPQPTSARAPSAAVVIKNRFRMYFPPQPKS